MPSDGTDLLWEVRVTDTFYFVKDVTVNRVLSTDYTDSFIDLCNLRIEI